MSRVDVVVPCYKYAAFLEECVRSVLNQEGVDVRVLILDDASPDHTPEVAARLVQEDSRVEYRRHAVNKRHIDTYNEGLLEWASGEYTLLLSADDVLARRALQRAAEVMDAHPEVGLCHGLEIPFDGDHAPTEPTAELVSPPVTIFAGEAFIESCCVSGFNPVCTPTAVVRTSLQHAVGGYRKSLPHTADMEMWLRIAARSGVAYLQALQAFKRRHKTNMQHQYLVSALGDIRERCDAFESFFRESNPPLREGARLQTLARLAMAANGFWAASRAFDRGDDAGCEECLEYAVQLNPALPSSKMWRRLVWKRRLGHAVWNLLHPLANLLRRRKPVPVP
jgi:glycosyltransferase involved in cell wall biosynthesis